MPLAITASITWSCTTPPLWTLPVVTVGTGSWKYSRVRFSRSSFSCGYSSFSLRGLTCSRLSRYARDYPDTKVMWQWCYSPLGQLEYRRRSATEWNNNKKSLTWFPNCWLVTFSMISSISLSSSMSPSTLHADCFFIMDNIIQFALPHLVDHEMLWRRTVNSIVHTDEDPYQSLGFD